MPRQVVYVSSACRPMQPVDLESILRVSRERNAAAGITGMLLHRDGNFMQCLEGPSDAITTTVARIQRDPRHRGMITLRDVQVAAATFADWSMGFRDLDTTPKLAEARSLLDIPAPAALKLLEHFNQRMR